MKILTFLHRIFFIHSQIQPTMHHHARRTIVLFIPLLLYLLVKQYEVSQSSESDKRSILNSKNAKRRRKKKRVLWTNVNERISDLQFKRKFRMDREFFSFIYFANALFLQLAKKNLSLKHILMPSLKVKIQCMMLMSAHQVDMYLGNRRFPVSTAPGRKLCT